jgi:RNA polymerase sigma factor (TIGR02999 family)
MDDSRRTAITRMLRDARAGDEGARGELFERVYGELRALAAQQLARGTGGTMQATVLVNEACLRLLDPRLLDVADRAHFFALAVTVMRRVLVDHHRRAHAARRGGERLRVTFDERLAEGDGGAHGYDVLALDEALDRLAALDARKARIVELRFFAGLSVPEVADALGVSTRTVESEWSFARAWLRGELHRGEGR